MARVAERISANVKREMRAQRMSQQVVGEAMGLSQTAVSDRLRGETPWRIDEVEIVAELLDLDLGALLGISTQPMAEVA